ncbi:MAG: lysylphosphatidylglycerol synthase domain-containing protein [Acidimicrobiia bacterium]
MTDPESPSPTDDNKQPLWKRLLPIIVGVAVMVFLFGFVLPQFIDYEAVFRAIGKIDGQSWAILIVLAFVRFLPEGLIYVAAQPGLSSGQGVQLFVVAETLANIPPGGLDLISRFQMTRSWGFSTASSTSATIASWVFASLSKIVLPIIAVTLLAARRVQQDELDALAIIALIAVIAGTALIVVVLRSPRLATWIGTILGKGVRAVAGIFRKEVATNFVDLVHEFRGQASEVLRTRTAYGFMAGLAARIAAFLVLLVAVRSVGISDDLVHWTIVFAAFSVVMAITVIPIFNMPGITEVILISTFVALAGKEFNDEIAAAVFVYRVLTWLAPIPFGGIAFNRWRDQVRESGDTDLLDAFDKDADAT